MHHQIRSINPADHIKPAVSVLSLILRSSVDTSRLQGRSFVGRDEGVQYCLVDGSTDPGRPVTPEKLRKWRAVKEPAARSLHPGYRNDAHLQDGSKVFGREPLSLRPALGCSSPVPLQARFRTRLRWARPISWTRGCRPWRRT